MNCISGHRAQFLCINPNCRIKNSFMCSDTHDQCKQNHESCSLINLLYLLKKSKHQNPSKSNPSKYDKLKPLQQKSKIIANTISIALTSANVNKEINEMLESGRVLAAEDKEKITKFMNDRKLDSAQDNIFFKLEKELEEFQGLIFQFNLEMKETRDREIEELRRKIGKDRDQRVKSSQVQLTLPNLNPSQVKSKVGEIRKSKKKIENQLEFELPKLQEERQSPSQKKRAQSGINQQESPIKEARSSKKKSKMQLNSSGMFQVMSKVLRNHIPKGPLFSKITNDVAAIYSFFTEGFKTATLLYRASENDYSVSKFHEKCDGEKHTLTIVLTEHDKIIGGFTPLPWSSEGDEWSTDHSKRTFLFSLTTGEKFPLSQKQKQRAIWCNKSFGPSFGSPDLQIADKAAYNSKSCSNFPKCFNNGNYKQTPGTSQTFCGSKSGNFRIREWEVYQLEF